MLPKELAKLNPKYLAMGKRGVIYTFTKNNIKYAIKIKNPDSKAKERIRNEAKYLKLLNKYNIGPELAKAKDNYIIYKFIPGNLLKNQKPTKAQIKQILTQCHKLDRLKINKMEMHHPLKHIILKNNKAYLIDFERCYKTNHPKNTTQFCQYLMGQNLLKNKTKLKQILKQYKKQQSEDNFNKILALL